MFFEPRKSVAVKFTVNKKQLKLNEQTNTRENVFFPALLAVIPKPVPVVFSDP